MSREEAIKYLNEFIFFKKISNITEEETIECFKLAIEALQQQPSENEQIIRISKGTLKARTGRYVVYDVEWLKTHFNTTEAKIYGQPNEDCISRQAAIDGLHRYFAEGFNEDRWWNSTYVLDIINKAPSVTPQSKAEGARGDIPLQQSVPEMPQPKTGHWINHKHGGIEHIECSECGVWFLKANLIRKSYCPNCGSCNGDMIKNIMRDITKTISGGAK